MMSFKDPDIDYTKTMVTCDPEIFVAKRRFDDKFLILATDGVWECLSNEKISACLEEKINLSDKEAPISKHIEEMFDEIIAEDILESAGTGTRNMAAIVI